MLFKSKNPQKPPLVTRKGYFLIFFSLVMMMLMLPVMIRQIEGQIQVYQDIEDWSNFTQMSADLDGLLPYIMRKKTEAGLGSFEFSEIWNVADLIEDLGSGMQVWSERLKDHEIQYSVSSAAIIPLPTATYTKGLAKNTRQARIVTDLGIDFHKECKTTLSEYKHGVYKNCNFQYDPDNGKFTYGDEDGPVDRDVQFFYTAPLVGTGTAAHYDDCYPYWFDMLKTYEDENGEQKFIDPLDHPCNWNRIQLDPFYPNAASEVVTIPLFTRDEDGNPVYHNPKIFTIRFRFPCTNGYRYCDPIYRPELKIFENDDSTYTPGQWEEERTKDDTNRMIDYALVSVDRTTGDETYFRPMDEFYRDETTGKYFRKYNNIQGFRNYNISQLRFRFYTNSPNEYLFNYMGKAANNINGDRVTNVNLISNRHRDDKLDDPLWHINFVHLTKNMSGFQLFNTSTRTNDGYAIYPGNYNQHTAIAMQPITGSNQELYLTFRLDGYFMRANPMVIDEAGTQSTGLRLNKIEYQVISDKPFGDSKGTIFGRIKHPEAGWQSSRTRYIRKSERFVIPRGTGVVFSN